MNWKTVKVIPQKKLSHPIDFKEAFADMFENDKLLKEELGEPFYEETTLEVIDLNDIPCHCKCKRQKVLLRRRYETSDNSHRALLIECPDCHESDLVIQESSHK